MPNTKDVKIVGAELYFLPVHNRMPLKFGAETVAYVTCARCKVTVEGRDGRTATGWGETPLSVTWVWPSSLSYEERHESLKAFCRKLAKVWPSFDAWGHPIEVGQDFITSELSQLQASHNNSHAATESMPWLASLVCFSLFDIAAHDAGRNQLRRKGQTQSWACSKERAHVSPGGSCPAPAEPANARAAQPRLRQRYAPATAPRRTSRRDRAGRHSRHGQTTVPSSCRARRSW